MQQQPLSRLAEEDIIAAIGQEWMLVTAGAPDDFNMLTASWGGIGHLWNKSVAFIFVRPERYTHEFIDRNERISLAFLGNDPQAREAYKLIGTRSGRDLDKAAATGLTPIATPLGSTTYAQARLTLEGRKLFQTNLRAEDFIDRTILDRCYRPEQGGLHTLYVIEIEGIYTP